MWPFDGKWKDLYNDSKQLNRAITRTLVQEKVKSENEDRYNKLYITMLENKIGREETIKIKKETNALIRMVNNRCRR